MSESNFILLKTTYHNVTMVRQSQGITKIYWINSLGVGMSVANIKYIKSLRYSPVGRHVNTVIPSV